MNIFTIASGSSGNCICVGNDRHHLLIDAGISGKKIEAGLNHNGLTTRDCDGILITHEHIDHVSGLGVIARKYNLPIYATSATIDCISSIKSLGNIDPDLFHPITAGESFDIEDFSIDPVHISHDAADPVAYVIADGEKRVGVCTDLGVYDDTIIQHMKNLNAIVLEANHDIRMLESGPYPYPLKMRILSDQGHLSNEASGKLLSKILNDHMKQIYLGHLSKDNNIAELAEMTVSLEVTMSDTDYKGNDFPIVAASRNEPSDLIEV